MTFASDSLRLSDFIQYEANPDQSREEITILAGSGAARVLTGGMVLGRTLASATEAAAAGGSNTGDGAMGAVTAGKKVKAGVYSLVCIATGTDVGTFAVFDPDGIPVKSAVGLDLVVAAAFASDHFSVTLADGATDFALGDTFTITMSALVHKYVRHETTGSDGSEIVSGILLFDKTAPDGTDAKGVALVRGPAIINKGQIVHDANATAAEIDGVLAALMTMGIVPATGVGSVHFGA